MPDETRKSRGGLVTAAVIAALLAGYAGSYIYLRHEDQIIAMSANPGPYGITAQPLFIYTRYDTQLTNQPEEKVRRAVWLDRIYWPLRKIETAIWNITYHLDLPPGNRHEVLVTIPF